jgi:hypothetical protein
MKKATFLLGVVFVIMVALRQTDVSVLRKYFYASATDKEMSAEFLKLTNGMSLDGRPMFLGFRAMALMLACNHEQNPFAKLNLFKEGKKLLEMAIQRDPDNPELIFFRFSTQTNIPPILGYRSNISSDKVELINYLKEDTKAKKSDQVLYNKIKEYLLDSKYCTGVEKNLISNLP